MAPLPESWPQASMDHCQCRANDVVIIRGILSTEQLATRPRLLVLSGIKLLAAKHLHVENCSIYSFTSPNSCGIEGANAAASELSVVNTSITNCSIGIRVSAVAGNSASANNVRIQKVTLAWTRSAEIPQ